MTDIASPASLITAIASVFRGQRSAIEQVATAFLAGGHVLVEDIPGVGKTTLARALAVAVGGTFRRLQCTPDLLPADVIGVSIYDEPTRSFVFHPGPVFCDVLLADELNRTPPRTQAALLEALSENQVSVEGSARPLSAAFFCIATQNPLDHAGTYPLPDNQRDRFLLRLTLGYPDPADELLLLAHDGAEGDLGRLGAVLDLPTLMALRAQARAVRVEDSVRRYLLELVRTTRGARQLLNGASPRAAIGLQRAAQAKALIAGRSFVIPEDVQALAVPVLAHRVQPRPGNRAEDVINGLVESQTVPL